MRTATCETTGSMTVREVPRPDPGPGEVLVRVRACGVCGTDLLKLYSPDIAKPVQLGHEVVGEVAAVGAGVAGWRVGQRLALAHHVPCYQCHYCRHGNVSMCATFKASNIRPGGFSEWVLAPTPHMQHTALPLPDDLPDERAVFVEPLACCVRALRRAPVQPGDTALIVGAGAMGLLLLALLQAHDCQALVLDLKPERLELAHQWGAVATLNPAHDHVAAEVRQASGGRGVDLVILTVANGATLSQAVGLVRDGGTIVIFGAKAGDQPAPADLWEIYRRELTLLSAYSAAPEDLPTALALLQRPDFPLERLVTHQYALNDINEAMAVGYAQQALKVIIRP